MKTTTPTVQIVINADGVLFTAEAAAAAGYVQEAEMSVGFLTIPKATDYAQTVVAIKVRSSSVDGGSRSRTFKTAEKAAAYIRAEGWAFDGVSDDGVTRYDGVSYQCTDTKHWYGDSTGALCRYVRNLARY